MKPATLIILALLAPALAWPFWRLPDRIDLDFYDGRLYLVERTWWGLKQDYHLLEKVNGTWHYRDEKGLWWPYEAGPKPEAKERDILP